MEYMRLEGVLGGAVSKLINKGIETKLGYKPNIRMDNLLLRSPGEDSNSVELSVNLSMSQSDFDKLIEEVTK